MKNRLLRIQTSDGSSQWLEMPSQSHEILAILAGALAMVVITVVSFEFGWLQ